MKLHSILVTFLLIASTLSAAAEKVSVSISSYQGSFTIFNSKGEEIKDAESHILTEGDSIITDANAAVTLTFSDGSSVVLDASTTITIQSLEADVDGPELFVQTGSVTATASNKAPIQLSTPEKTVVVKEATQTLTHDEKTDPPPQELDPGPPVTPTVDIDTSIVISPI